MNPFPQLRKSNVVSINTTKNDAPTDEEGGTLYIALKATLIVSHEEWPIPVKIYGYHKELGERLAAEPGPQLWLESIICSPVMI